MCASRLTHYLYSCGWLLVPALLWNAALSDRLPLAYSPEQFGHAIPIALIWAENALRGLVFALPLLMPLRVESAMQRRALCLICAGSLIYFASWLPLMLAPAAGWSRSAAGFLAPAYTPLLWLGGLALLGRQVHGWRGYRWWYYLLLSVLFTAVHVAHAGLVYARLY